MPTSPEPTPVIVPRSRPAWEGIMVAAVAAAICGFYLWTASSNANDFELKGLRNDYYNQLMHGFIEGHASMKVAPLAEKPAGPDPNGLGNLPFLLDASFYRGKYYLYFGPAPVLTVFLPYRILTGSDLSDNLAAALLAGGGYVVSLGLLWLVRRRYFPGAPWWSLPLFAVLLGLGNACAVMLRHPLFYEAAIACAFFFQALFLLGLFFALTGGRTGARVVWLGCASLACGLSVGARANYAFTSIALGVALAWFWRCREDRASWCPRSFRPLALAALGPVSLCAAGLMGYNYLRFGRVLEFGVSYQFTYRPVFGLRFLPHNLKLYYFSLPEFSWYFPFVQPIRETFRPEGYVGIEQLHGQAWSTIWLLPVLAGAGLVGSRRFATRRPLAVLYACALVCALANLVVLLCLAGRANRYMVDFQPVLLLLGAIGVLAWNEGVNWTPIRRALAWAPLALWVVAVGLHNFFASFQLYELFKDSNPGTYGQLATVMNAPTHWAGRWLYPELGPVRLRVSFPAGGPQREREPLLVTGAGEYADFILVDYQADGFVRFILVHPGYPEILSAPVQVGVGQPHELEIDHGSLYPPLAHPFFAPFSRGERMLIKRNVGISLDGRVVFTAKHDLYDASPDRVYVGENPAAPFQAEPWFGGRLGNVRRAGLAAVLARKSRETQGPVVLHLLFPADVSGRNPEPLVVTGERGRGDAIFVKYEDDRHVRFGVDHWGGGSRLSEPVEVDRRVPHVLEIGMGSLYPAAGDARFAGFSAHQVDQLKGVARVKLDGREVFLARGAFHEADPSTVDLGSNAIGLSTCRALFGGEILDAHRASEAAPGSVAASGAGLGPWRARVTFPAGRTGQSEPLVSTGGAGRGDVIFVTYLDDRSVRFTLDHAGAPPIVSAPVPLDYRGEHAVEIDLGSLYTAEGLARLSPFLVSQAGKSRHQVRVSLDGREVFAAPSDFHASRPDEIEVGLNRIGAAGGGKTFGGVIRQVEYPGFGPAERKTGPAVNYGPVQFELSFPQGQAGRSEPLVVTGRTGAGDALIVTYAGDRQIKLGWDHWGLGGPSSALIPVDYKEWHLLEVDMGSLYAADAPALQPSLTPEEIARRRGNLQVKLDGEVVFSAQGAFHPAAAAEMRVGENFIGASGMEAAFSGSIEQIQRPGVTPAAR